MPKDPVEKIEERVEEIRRELIDLRTKDITHILVEIGKLQIKAGIWGGLSGIMAVIGAILLKML